MARLLICGVGPLPFEPCQANLGPGIRTWQFASGLASAGHQVDLVTGELMPSADRGAGSKLDLHESVRLHRISLEEMMEPRIVTRLVHDNHADAVVGATLLGSFAVARAECGLPFWADQFGHSMAEAQAKAALAGDDRAIAETWNLVRRVAARADKFSVVSKSQRFAMIGELGALGRLNARNTGYELVEVIPCAVRPSAGHIRATDRPEIGSPRDDFHVLWSGSFNVWSDVETLVAALEVAMDKEPRVRFIATGGEVPGHDESTFRRLQRLVAESPLRDRFHLAGWVEPAELQAYQNRADLAIMTESPIYEGMLGSKNRILDWMQSGIPVLCTELGELSSYLADHSLALTVSPGDVRAATEAILWAANHPHELQQMAQKARSAAETDFSVSATTAALREWARSPRRAPDSATLRGPGDPMAYASWLDRFAAQVQRVRLVERSTGARRLWRRLRGRLDSSWGRGDEDSGQS